MTTREGKRLKISARKAEIIRWIEESNNTISNFEIKRKLGISHGTWMKYNAELGINYAGNPQHKGVTALIKPGKYSQYADPTVFTANSNIGGSVIKRHLTEVLHWPDQCGGCGLSAWNDFPIPLETDHINGIRSDNRIKNLRRLCPNCHAQTPTYRRKKQKNCKLRVSDEDLIHTYKKNNFNMQDTLRELKIPSNYGSYYKRIDKLLLAQVDERETGRTI